MSSIDEFGVNQDDGLCVCGDPVTKQLPPKDCDWHDLRTPESMHELARLGLAMQRVRISIRTARRCGPNADPDLWHAQRLLQHEIRRLIEIAIRHPEYAQGKRFRVFAGVES